MYPVRVSQRQNNLLLNSSTVELKGAYHVRFPQKTMRFATKWFSWRAKRSVSWEIFAKIKRFATNLNGSAGEVEGACRVRLSQKQNVLLFNS